MWGLYWGHGGHVFGVMVSQGIRKGEVSTSGDGVLSTSMVSIDAIGIDAAVSMQLVLCCTYIDVYIDGTSIPSSRKCYMMLQ